MSKLQSRLSVCRIAGFQPADLTRSGRARIRPVPCRFQIGDTADCKSALRHPFGVTQTASPTPPGFERLVPAASRGSAPIPERRRRRSSAVPSPYLFPSGERQGTAETPRSSRVQTSTEGAKGYRGIRMTRMGTGFVMVESLFRGHPRGEQPFHRNPFFIRVIREIRGSNCCF